MVVVPVAPGSESDTDQRPTVHRPPTCPPSCYRAGVRDGVWRRAVKRVARWHYELELGLHRAWRRARGERPFALGGECRRCAACCEAPAIAVGRVTWSMPNVRRVFLAWQRHVNGFEQVGQDPRRRTFVFRCTHFDAGTRSCDSYESRPAMCRDYPRRLLWQPSPELLPGCGYRAVAPNAAGLRASLARLALTSEQRKRLDRGLHLGGSFIDPDCSSTPPPILPHAGGRDT